MAGLKEPPASSPMETMLSISSQAPATTMDASETAAPVVRETLEGAWILDKSREDWSMRGYLETLHVNELAIQAHEKGEADHDTVHTISYPENAGDFANINIVKRSRVNNDLVVALTMNEEHVELLKPDSRPKKSLATTEDPGVHLLIQSSLLTMNGLAHVTDVKRLVRDADTGGSILVQELTIINDKTQESKTTIRYFKPHTVPEAPKTEGLAAAMDLS